MERPPFPTAPCAPWGGPAHSSSLAVRVYVDKRLPSPAISPDWPEGSLFTAPAPEERQGLLGSLWFGLRQNSHNGKKAGRKGKIVLSATFTSCLVPSSHVVGGGWSTSMIIYSPLFSKQAKTVPV